MPQADRRLAGDAAPIRGVGAAGPLGTRAAWARVPPGGAGGYLTRASRASIRSVTGRPARATVSMPGVPARVMISVMWR